MKKGHIIITISVIFVLTLLFSIFFKVSYKSLTTDSGFDSSYDSGGSDSGSSWSSSDYGSSGSGGGNSSPETALGVFYIFLASLAGFGVRKLFLKIKDDEEALMDVIFSMVFLVPLSIITGLLGEGNIAALVIGYGILTIFFLAFNIVRKKPIYKYLPVEYITFFGLILFIVLADYLATGNIDSLIIFFIFLATFIPFIIIYFVLRSVFTLNKGVFTKVDESTSQDIQKELEENNLKEEDILNDAFEIYKRVQIAWMNNTIDDVEDCLSDEMRNMYKAQLFTLSKKGQKNIMSDIEYVSGNVLNIKNCHSDLEITLGLKVTCKDYIINSTGKVLRGNKNKINHYHYKLTFLLNREGPKNCPNCGEKIKEAGGVTCPSCKSKIVYNNGKMMMTKKTMIEQH